MKIEEEKKIFNNINKTLDKQFSPRGKQIFFVLIGLAIAALIFVVITFMLPKKQSQNLEVSNLPEIENVDVQAAEEPNNTVETDIIDIEKTADKMVSLTVEDYGRANPFLPEHEVVVKIVSNPYGNNLIAPPESIVSGSEASKVMETKISGIMYDASSPSAILNIEGEDYLVRAGDYINNYKVLAISKDLVTVQLGSNVYKAKVGEVIQEGEINYNNVYNLEQKFGGAKNSRSSYEK